MRARLTAAASILVFVTLSSVPAFAQGFRSVFTRDGTDVWAVGDAGVTLRSFDGGLTWTSAINGSRTLRAVAARGFNVLIVGDSGSVWHSVNSGGAWTTSACRAEPICTRSRSPRT